MNSIVSPVLNLLPKLCDLVGEHTGFICRLEENKVSLITEKEQLLELKNDVTTRVSIARDQNMRPREQVLGWLRRVEEFEREVDSITREVEDVIQRSCISKYCSMNCRSTYKLGKKVSRKLADVVTLRNRGQFDVVADAVPGAVVDRSPVDEIVGENDTLEEIRNCIADSKKGIIGLWGMGGVGKTTLLGKVSNELQGYDTVMWVVVPKSQSLEIVQDKIGRKLGLLNENWKEESLDEKASHITNFLHCKKFVLLLDDLWSRVDLVKLGVPLPNERNGSKVIFTTRQKDVCHRMGASCLIEVNCLSPNDSWNLFKSKVGEEVFRSQPQILKVAKLVAEKCRGLPLALIVIGRCMASKTTLEEWEFAKNALSTEASDLTEEVLPILKYSYDNLQNVTLKSCFLYFSLLPAGRFIRKTDLTDLWIGEGFLDEQKSISEAIHLGHDIIGKLQLACLLETVDEGVKMHDVIREMALWVVTEFKKQNFISLADLNRTADLDSIRWETSHRILLQSSEIEEVSITPNCPHLLTLSMEFPNAKDVSNGFFESMPALKVLLLSTRRIVYHKLNILPQSFFQLTSLEHLDMSCTSIEELPIEFRNLRNLKYLFLNHMSELCMISPDIIDSLSKLKRLGLFYYSIFKDMRGSLLSGDGNEALVDKLESLPELQTLEISLKTKLSVRKLLGSKKMSKITNRLMIHSCKGTNTLELLPQPCDGITTLTVSHCDDLQKVTTDSGEETGRLGFQNIRNADGYFVNLQQLGISDCRELKDVTFLVRLPRLKYLNISKCRSLEEIIQGDNSNAFLRLVQLHLWDLPSLKSISTLPLSFPRLVIISVGRCLKLKKLPLDSSSATNTLEEIRGDQEWWDQLEWEDQTAGSTFASCFKPY